MGYIKFMRQSISDLPEQTEDGAIYFLRDGSVAIDVGSERRYLNPQPDWAETSLSSLKYIKNKPDLGTVSSYDVLPTLDENEQTNKINQSSNIPTSRQVYAAIHELKTIIATLEGSLGRPEYVKGVADMVDTTVAYVYVPEGEAEEGMTKGHWYYYNTTTAQWTDGGNYFTGLETDTSLLRSKVAADAAAVGTQLVEIRGSIEELLEKLNDVDNFMEAQDVLNASYCDDLEVTSDGLVYILNNGVRIAGPFGPFAGNGSGSGGSGSDVIDAEFDATNLTEWNTITISDGDNAYFTFTWESIENGSASGQGTVTITVNNVSRGTISVPQGENTINLKNYYTTGNNKIRIRIADQYDQGKTWIVNVNAVKLTISSSFSTATPFTEAIPFTYTPTGSVSKNIFFVIDKGTENETTYTNVTSVSDKQLSYTFPALSHGAHTLDVHFTAEINGETVPSNKLHYEMICIEDGETDTIIVSPFIAYEQKQYASVVIPYTVYDPAGLTTTVTIYVDDVLVVTQTDVDMSQHYYTYKANTAGEVEIKIVCKNTTKTIPLTVEASSVHITAETESLALHLEAEGRSNADANKTSWTFTPENGSTISAQLTDFNWQLDGWMNDDDGVNVLRTFGDSRVYIPYKPFIRNFDSTGQTIELEFATHNVIDYSTPIISCYANGIGFVVTPQTITFNSAQVELMTPFKDNEHIRVTIVVHKQTADRLILFYVNGIMSSAVQYPSGENFRQGSDNVAVGITIGSNTCGVDIYNIRIYNTDLNKEQVLNNWIADTKIGDLMYDRYNRNNIYDEGVIKPSTLPSNLPYFIITATALPDYKGDKKTCSISFTDPASPAKSYTAEGVQINVQGTSSQAYYRKNYDLQFKKGFELSTGHADTYSIIDSIPFNRFVLKADVASSESANNTRLVMFYNDTCPYKIPEMLTNPKVRWGIEGRPCVVFWYNPDTGDTEFLGKFNANLPKRAPEPYGYSGNDESWEVERNNSANVQFQDNDFTSQVFDEDDQKWKPAWYDDWEARMPSDEWRNIEKLYEFVTWVKSTDTSKVTKDTDVVFDEPITFRVDTTATLTNYSDDESYTVVTEKENGQNTGYYNITFTKDTPAYRLTKFRAEAPLYMEIESATFYYLFTLFFLMIDSRAKNMFFGFHGSPASGLQYIDRKVVFEPYDMDTGLGTNNSGVLKFGYYHLDTDTVSNIISGSTTEDDISFTVQCVSVADENVTNDFTITYEQLSKLEKGDYSSFRVTDSSDGAYIEFYNDGTYLYSVDSEAQGTFVFENASLVVTDSNGDSVNVTKRVVAQNAPVFNGQGSVLWINFREAFRAEYVAMYKSLRATDEWTYDYIENMYEEHQAYWPEALFNEDAYVKYIVPLVQAVTIDEETKKPVKTDRYLTMLQGSKEQQRKWWLQNRFRYFDSMMTTGSAETSFIEMRLFNSGTLQVTPAQDMYVGVRFGRGSTTQRVRATAGVPVSFTYSFNSNADLSNEQTVVNEMESTIFSANLIEDVGDLSVFYGNEFDFSRATRLRRLKLGDSAANYNNANLNKLNVSNCFLLEEIDCRNCSALTQPINLESSPMLERAYFDGTKITSLSLAEGAPVTNVHLPSSITSLILMDHSKLTDFTCPSLSNVSTLMMRGIPQSVLDPLDVLGQIQQGSRINIQGLAIEVTPPSGDLVVEEDVTDEYGNVTGTQEVTYSTDAEKAGYLIEQFLKSVDTMHGVTREKLENGEWDYSSPETPVISGSIHTSSLTGAQIAYFNSTRDPHYPYLNFSATNISSKITFKDWDGSALGDNGTDVVVQCSNGVMQANAPTSLTRASTAQYSFTFVGWSRNMDASAAQSDALSEIIADRVVYAAYSRTVRTYTVTWKNANGTVLETDTGVAYGSTPTYNGSTPTYDGQNSTGWTPSITAVTGDVTYTATYKPQYTITFVTAAADGGVTLQSSRFVEGTVPTYSGTTPTTTRGSSTEFEFIGWSPSLTAAYTAATYTAVFQDKRSIVIQYLVGAMTAYESTTNTTNIGSYTFQSRTSLKTVEAPVTSIEAYAFSGCTGLTTVDLTSESGAITIAANAFNGCTNLDSLYIRSTTVATLSATSAFTGTKIGNSKGTIYVPRNLLATYKADTNWKNYVLRAIEDYPDGTKNTEFGTITDSWETIATNANYATDYVIGDTKTLVLGTYGTFTMELVGIDADTKSDGTGTAHTTWVMKEIFTTHNMNSSNTTSGGWSSSGMRSWLQSTVKAQLPEYLKNNIVKVDKVSSTYSSSVVVNGQTTSDDLWIPSNHEVGFGTSYESTGPVYSKFNSNSARIKYNTSGSASYWWLRSVISSAGFRIVYSDGSANNYRASNSYGVVLGFCI